MGVAPFVVFEPEQDSPVLVEVPHAGLLLDAEAASWTTAPARSIARDADLYVDELFADAPAVDATLLCANISRYVVDLNRAPDDYDGASVRGGPPRARPRGLIWRLTSEGTPVLREPVSPAEYARRRDSFHAPYHHQLSALLERKRARFGLAVLLCAHSMPSPRPQRGRAVYTADVVPGSRGHTSADERFVDLVGRVGIDAGWRVEHDVPYRGGYSTGHYGRPDEGLHAVQIELARRLYMDENSLARSPEGFAAVRAFAKQLVSELVREARAAADP